MTYEVSKTDEQWALELQPQEFAVLRRAGTERPWTGELLDEKREASTAVGRAATSCSGPTRSSTRTAAGPASSRPWPATAWS